MAVIYRDRLVGEAKKIADKGIAAQIVAGDTSLIALQQQRAINDAIQQQLVAQTNSSLGQVQDNIYQAQRQKRAESAMLGLQSDVTALRDTAEVQDMIAQELSNIIDQTEQGAIGIAGQQSAINKAEVQTASQSVLDSYADNLIETGVAKQDTGRMVLNGLTGALGGAIQGLLGGAIIGTGVKGLLNPTSGIVRKTISGLATAGGLSMAINGLGGFANTIDKYRGGEGNIYNQNTSRQIQQYGLLGGALIGAGLGGFDKYAKNVSSRFLGNSSRIVEGLSTVGSSKNLPAVLSNGFTSDIVNPNSILNKSDAFRNTAINWIRGGASKQGVSKLASIGDDLIKAGTTGGKVAGNLAKGAANIGGKASSLLKLNPWLLAASAGLGAIFGGLKGGLQKKYTLNLDDIRGTDTYNQFQDFGLDVDQVADIIYNK